jgi:hypothetical protein
MALETLERRDYTPSCIGIGKDHEIDIETWERRREAAGDRFMPGNAGLRRP